MLPMDKFIDTLRDKGYKATPQRIAVHQAMSELGHATAEQVSEYIRGHALAQISEASVYNTLNQLSHLGIYAQRMSRDSKLHFDANTSRHIHLYDRVNHEFREIEDEKGLEILEKYFRGRRWRGYRFEGLDVSLIVRPSVKKKQTP